MQTAARMPPLGPFAAITFVAGAGAVLLAPMAIPAWVGAIALLAGLITWCGRRRAGPVLAGLGLAMVTVAWALSLRLPATLERGDFLVRGTVEELPVHEARRTSFLFRVAPDNTQPALRGRLLRLSWYETDRRVRTTVMPGEHWQFLVRLRAPRGLRNPGAADSEKFALARHLTATGYLRDVDSARRLSQARGLDAWRAAMSLRIRDSVPSDTSRFVSALALGDVRGLRDADWRILRSDGLTHLIAISGFHVGLVAGLFALIVRGVWWLFPRFPQCVPAHVAAAVAGACGAAVYAVVAGSAVPTVRTALAIGLIAMARIWRRPLTAADALSQCAIMLVACDPLALLGAGFWLSFLGVAWLLWCLPATEDTSVRGRLRGFLSAQGVATLGLLPLAAALFGQASLAGPVANLVAVPWWSLVVVPLSLLGLGAESLHAGAGTVFWHAAAGAFDVTWPAFVRLGASPLAFTWLAEPAWYALPLALAGTFWMLLPRGLPGRWLGCLLWLPLMWPDRHLPHPGEADLLLVDVGQGLSVVVRTSRHTLLYDMGPAVKDGFDAGERAVVPALHAWGVRRIDRAMASHGDNDHVGGLQAVAAGFSMPGLWAPEGAPLRHAGNCQIGQSWNWDGVRFRVLHPTPYFPYLGNESSCVLRIDTARGSILLPGDIGSYIERELVHRDAASLAADIVVVAHHGSGGSSDPAFVAATGARYALVSSGYGNRFRHPRPDVVARWSASGARVLDTQDLGAIEVRLREGGIRVIAQRLAHPRAWDAAKQPVAATPRLSYRPD